MLTLEVVSFDAALLRMGNAMNELFEFASPRPVRAAARRPVHDHGLRVTEEDEVEGLDLAEHGGHGYDLGTGSLGLLDGIPADHPSRRGKVPATSTSSLAVSES